MKGDAKTDCYNWHREERKAGAIFNLQRDIVRYCQMDVEILRIACMKFRQLVLDNQHVDPFLCSTTVASMCMYIYRHNFLAEEKIAVVPSGGYRKHEKQSLVAIKWLKYISETHNLNIQHAKKRR